MVRRSTEPTAPLTPPPVAEAQAQVAEVFGNISEFWGFTRTQGRVFGLLYVSPEPLCHGDVRERLGISAGSASMTLASLVDWGVIRREGRSYVAETDFWRVITGVLRRRERTHVENAINRLGTARERLAEAPADDPRVVFVRQRVKHLLGFFQLGRRFLDAFVGGNPLRALLNSITRRSRELPRTANDDQSDVRIGA